MNTLKRIYAYLKENRNEQVDIKALALAHHEMFLMVPLFAFVITPVYQFLSSVLFDSGYAFGGFYTFKYTVDYAVYLSLVITPIALVIYCIKKRKDGSRIFTSDCIPMIFFALVALLIIISTCINGFTDKALSGDFARGESIFTFLAYFLCMYLCGSLIEKESNKKIIINTFLFSNVFINILALVHIYIKPLACWEYSDHDEISAIFYQFNHYGYYLMLGIMVSAAIFVTGKGVKSKIISALILALNTYILTLNTTFGCFLACLAGFVFLIIADSAVRKKFSFMTLAAFAVFMLVTFIGGIKGHSFITELGSFFKDVESVLGVVNESVVDTENGTVSSAADSAGTGRWGLWRNTIGYIREKPLTGWGIEGIADRLEKDSNGVNNRPHSEYLEYAAFFGIPAALLYIGGMAASFLRAVMKRRYLTPASVVCLTAAFTYLFSAVFGNTMFYTAAYLFIFLGLAVRTEKKEI